jgi:hypothetical protein
MEFVARLLAERAAMDGVGGPSFERGPMRPQAARVWRGDQQHFGHGDRPALTEQERQVNALVTQEAVRRQIT